MVDEGEQTENFPEDKLVSNLFALKCDAQLHRNRNTLPWRKKYTSLKTSPKQWHNWVWSLFFGKTFSLIINYPSEFFSVVSTYVLLSTLDHPQYLFYHVWEPEGPPPISLKSAIDLKPSVSFKLHQMFFFYFVILVNTFSKKDNHHLHHHLCLTATISTIITSSKRGLKKVVKFGVRRPCLFLRQHRPWMKTFFLSHESKWKHYSRTQSCINLTGKKERKKFTFPYISCFSNWF